MLRELNPRFLGTAPDGDAVQVATLAEADRLHFDCPCGGDHVAGVGLRWPGKPRPDVCLSWDVTAGSTFDDLTLSPSIRVSGRNGECWHGFVVAGKVQLTP